jgi:hypothetical protein
MDYSTNSIPPTQNKLFMMARHHHYNTCPINLRKYKVIKSPVNRIRIDCPTTATTPSNAFNSISDNDDSVSYACPALCVTIT